MTTKLLLLSLFVLVTYSSFNLNLVLHYIWRWPGVANINHIKVSIPAGSQFSIYLFKCKVWLWYHKINRKFHYNNCNIEKIYKVLHPASWLWLGYLCMNSNTPENNSISACDVLSEKIFHKNFDISWIFCFKLCTYCVFYTTTIINNVEMTHIATYK